MSPHRDPRRYVYQLEMTRFSHPLLSLVSIVDIQFEMSIEFFRLTFFFRGRGTVPSSEFGVCCESWTRYVVSEESRVGEDVSEGDHVVVSDYSTSTVQGEFFRRFDDPVIVRIVERVSSHLLTCDKRKTETEKNEF